MEFNYKILKFNDHESSVNVEFTPIAAEITLGATVWIKKIYYVTADYAAEATQPDKDAYIELRIAEGVPGVAWEMQKAVFALSVADPSGADVNITAAEYDILVPAPGPLDFLTVVSDSLVASKDRIDVMAGEARKRQLSSGVELDREHWLAEQQAQAYKDAGYTGTVPPMVQAHVDAHTVTATVAADAILAAAALLLTKLESIRSIRLAAKVALDADVDAAARHTTLVAKIALLDAV